MTVRAKQIYILLNCMQGHPQLFLEFLKLLSVLFHRCVSGKKNIFHMFWRLVSNYAYYFESSENATVFALRFVYVLWYDVADTH